MVPPNFSINTEQIDENTLILTDSTMIRFHDHWVIRLGNGIVAEKKYFDEPWLSQSVYAR